MKIQHYTTVAIVALILSPSTVDAAWWNPLTWFSRQPTAAEYIQIPQGNTAATDETRGREDFPETTSATDVLPATGADTQTLREELQELRSSIKLSTNIITTESAQEDEQLLAKLNMLEQRLTALENQIRNEDYATLASRIESLERRPISSSEDQSVRIKELIRRVNSLSQAGYIQTNAYGHSSASHILCDLGEQTTESLKGDSRSVVIDTRTCKSMFKDLVY